MKLYIVIKYVDAMNFKSADMKQSLEWWLIVDLHAGLLWKVDNTKAWSRIGRVAAMLQVSSLVL